MYLGWDGQSAAVRLGGSSPTNAALVCQSYQIDCVNEIMLLRMAPHVRRCVRELSCSWLHGFARVAEDCAASLRDLEVYGGADVDVADLACALPHMRSLRSIVAGLLDR